MSTGDDLDLSEAYAVETPDDNRDLYARWASTYESGFIARHEYVYHQGVAAVFAEAAGPDDAPVLDVGCGTGLVGVALRALGVDAIDGLDLSPEMLDEARTKVDGDGSPVYGDLHVGDLTAVLDLPDGGVASVISAGTFTPVPAPSTSCTGWPGRAPCSPSGSIRTTSSRTASPAGSPPMSMPAASRTLTSAGCRPTPPASTPGSCRSSPCSGRPADRARLRRVRPGAVSRRPGFRR